MDNERALARHDEMEVTLVAEFRNFTVISTDEDNALYTKALFLLTSIDEPTSTQIEDIEALTQAIKQHEALYALTKGTAVSVVKLLMEGRKITEHDLVPEFGTESAVSLFLSGQRNLTLQQVQRLSQRFKLSADVFLD